MALSKIPSELLEGAVSFDASAPADSLVIDSSGNVGIGTSSPSRKLHISGSGSTCAIRIDNTVSGRPALLAYDDSQNLTLTNSSDSGYFAYVNGTGAGTERMRIDSAGRVTMPYQPCFSMDANGTVYGNTNVILSRGLNIGNCVNTSTEVFTAPVSGVYQFTAYSIKNNSSGTVARLTLKINGSAVGEARMDEGGNYCQAAMIFIAQLSANDTANFANTDSTGFYMDGFYGRCTGQLIG